MDKMIKMKNTLLWFILCFILFSCTSDYEKPLGNKYFYYDEGGTIKAIYNQKSEGGAIPPTVLKYQYNREYIIVKQKPKLPQDILYEQNYKYKNGTDKDYYWIIIKKKDKVLGPMTKDEYVSARKKYNVPEKLRIE